LFHVSLNSTVTEFATNQTLGIKNSVGGVHCYLVLGSITNQTFSISETNITGSCAVTLIISDDLNFSVLEYTNA